MDNGWQITPLSLPTADPASWPLLCNGALGVVACPSSGQEAGISAHQTLITSSSTTKGSMQSFDFCDVCLEIIGDDGLGQPLMQVGPPQSATLDMLRGVLRVTFAISASASATVVHEMRVLMHAPTMAMHTISVTGLVPGMRLRAHHTVRAPPGVACDLVTFRGDSFADPIPAADDATFVMTASAPVENGRASIVCSSSYIGSPCIIRPPSYTQDTTSSSSSSIVPSCTATVSLGPSLPPMSDIRLSVITSCARVSLSLEEADDLCRGMLLFRFIQQLKNSGDPGSEEARIISAHEAAWASRWAARIEVTFASPPPTYSVSLVRALRYAMFNLLSCARRDGCGAVIDRSVACGDDFLTNALVLVNPSGAKAVLEGKLMLLASAIRTARMSGLLGGTIGGSLAESMMASIDAWNYYRVTGDMAWLAGNGISIIRASADYATSITPPTSALDVAVTLAALKVATEACYVLRIQPSREWLDLRYALVIPFRITSSSILAGDPLASLRALSEPILSLTDGALTIQMIAPNVAAAADSTTTSALQDFIILRSLAQVSQAMGTSTSSAAFEAQLTRVLDRYSGCNDGWGNLSSCRNSSNNDIMLSSLLVCAVTQGLAGVCVQGGYTQTGYEYASPGINTMSVAVLPSSWDRLTLGGLGGLTDVVLLNSGTSDSLQQVRIEPWRMTTIGL